jgi:archaellum component FlaC
VLSEAIVVSLIVAVGGVLAAIFGRQIRLIRLDASASRRQVENSHPTNLRDDMDDQHREVMGQLGRVADRLEGTASDIRGIRKDIGRLESKDDRLDDRIHELDKEMRIKKDG